MEYSAVVAARRMVRAFDDRPVGRPTVDGLLDQARRAPSAGFTQGVDFVVLEGAETARYWDTCLPAAERPGFPWPGLLLAPVLVLPMADRGAYLRRYAEPDKAATGLADEQAWPVPYWDIDCAFATMALLLGAVDAGLGALFFGIFSREDELRRRLAYPDSVHPIGVVALGHPAEDRPSRSVRRGRRPLHEVVHRGGW